MRVCFSHPDSVDCLCSASELGTRWECRREIEIDREVHEEANYFKKKKNVLEVLAES